jgi:hypothetical protein
VGWPRPPSDAPKKKHDVDREGPPCGGPSLISGGGLPRISLRRRSWIRAKKKDRGCSLGFDPLNVYYLSAEIAPSKLLVNTLPSAPLILGGRGGA